LQTGGQSGRWAEQSAGNSQTLSASIPALEGGEDQVAHVMDIALDAREAVMVNTPVLVAALLDAGAFLVQFLLKLVQQRFIRECLAVASKSKTGRGVATVPIFLLVPQVKLRKRLDLAQDAERAVEGVPESIVAGWRDI